MNMLLLLAALAVPAAAADALNRKVAPPLTAERRVEEPKTARPAGRLPMDVTTDNERPYVTLIIALGAAGEAVQPPGLGGLAQLTAGLIQKGAVVRGPSGKEGKLDARAFARAFEDLAASVTVQAAEDATLVTVTTLRETLSETLALVAAAIRRPNLEAPDFELLKRQMLLGLKQEALSPQKAAANQAKIRIYGEHPYGSVATPASIAQIALSDVRTFHAASFGPTSVSAVGAVDAETLKRLAEEHFLTGPGLGLGDLARARSIAQLPPPDVRAAASEGGIDLISLPGSEQSFIMVVQAGLEREHEDYPSLKVVNMILGGVHESRLELIIREEKGWAYSARSSASALKRGGRVVLRSSVRADMTAQAVRTMIEQLERLRAADVTPEELAAAKMRLLSGIDGIFETNEGIVELRAGQAVLGLPADDLARLRAKIVAVTIADVRRVAERYLRPDACAVVIAGDKAVLPGLQALRPARAVNVIEPLEAAKPGS